MRYTYIIIGLVFLMCACSEHKSQTQKILFPDQIWENEEYTLIDKIPYDIDKDEVKDTILVYKIKDWSDPGDYQRLDIKLSSGELTKIYNLGDWINMEKEQLDRFQNINKLKSKRFLITDISKEKTLLIIFGWAYASSPGKLTIIELRKGNLIPILQTKFDLLRLEDLDYDGEKELIGGGFKSQMQLLVKQ
ncbi:MAG: hypothetical protein WBK94_02395 [Tenuifilaceae bacterium]|jgi:hypothetical protein|nr:hypothetical protein [Tenuifilaceae bacterium]